MDSHALSGRCDVYRRSSVTEATLTTQMSESIMRLKDCMV